MQERTEIDLSEYAIQVDKLRVGQIVEITIKRPIVSLRDKETLRGLADLNPRLETCGKVSPREMQRYYRSAPRY